MKTALELIAIFNAATPGIAELILLIRQQDGTLSVVALLDAADAQFAANIKQAQDWLAAHPQT